MTSCTSCVLSPLVQEGLRCAQDDTAWLSGTGTPSPPAQVLPRQVAVVHLEDRELYILVVHPAAGDRAAGHVQGCLQRRIAVHQLRAPGAVLDRVLDLRGCG